MNKKIAAIILCFCLLLTYLFIILPLKNELSEAKKELQSSEMALKKEKDKPPKVKTEVITKTEFAYIPKETVIYKDAQTGKTIQSLENTDIEIRTDAPNIFMKYNDAKFLLPGITDEKNKFEKGKFVGQISTNATIDVTNIVEKELTLRMKKNEKHISLGTYLTNKGLVTSIGAINKNFEIKAMASIPDPKKFYGGGLEWKF